MFSLVCVSGINFDIIPNGVTDMNTLDNLDYDGFDYSDDSTDTAAELHNAHVNAHLDASVPDLAF